MTAQKKGVILGDMLELGADSLAEHEAIARLVADSAFDLILFIGPYFQKVNEDRDIPSFIDSAQAASWLLEHRPDGYTILIKGSRGIQTEKVVPSL
jgi:UDP-N-acetylmuramoyl-tripeptide--D-alanyl-D-alanine ligase